MTIEDDVMAELRESRLLNVLGWAASAAFAATDQIYDEDAGHDQSAIGSLNFKHLLDLTDRATSNGRFVLGEGVGGIGSDVLERGITPAAFSSMPPVSAGSIVRSNYRQSPGWAAGEYRVLLQSYTFGRVDEIKWGQRSDAKRRVASQRFVGQSTLFDDSDFGLEPIPGIPDEGTFSGLTLVAAHAFNPVTKQFELYVGQSKNPGYPKDSCWHWRRLVLAGGTPLVDSNIASGPVLPGDAASTNVADVLVRIKKPFAAENLGMANE